MGSNYGLMPCQCRVSCGGANNINAVWQRHEEDHVASEWHASEFGHRLRTHTTDLRLCRPQTQFFVEAVHPEICIEHAVFGDEVPDV